MTVGGKSLAEAKIQRGILQKNALSQCLFVIAIMPLNHILTKYTAGYKPSKSYENINHLMYMDGIKLFAKNIRIGYSNIRSENIESGYRDGIRHRKMRHAKNKRAKWHMTDGTKQPNQEKIRTLWETYKIGNIGS